MGSVRRRGGVVRVALHDPEVVLLASLAGQVHGLLVDMLPEGLWDDTADPLQALITMPSADVAAPGDPIMRRLLPDAYRDDPDAAGEYRRLMDADLRLQKAAALRRILDDLAGGQHRKGGELRLDLTRDAAEQWLYGLTDIRLVLGTMLDVTEEIDQERASLEPGSPRFMQFGIYDWVTWLQDEIIQAVSD